MASLTIVTAMFHPFYIRHTGLIGRLVGYCILGAALFQGPLGVDQASAAKWVGSTGEYQPRIAEASDEGVLAIKGYQPQEGFKIELIAAEPHLANPVSFYIDDLNQIYVTETFRHSDGVLDIRGIMPWLDEDLASSTVDQRLAMTLRHYGDRAGELARESERVKLLKDSNGDGVMDVSTVFAEGFDGILDGIAAGVIARQGQVWLTNIPDLWALEDKDGDGVADWRKSLSHGYGVRVGFLGHDLHGLTFGPDGKLYFSIGDRGAHIETAQGAVSNTESGSVFRCNPDGSDLEIFATGLRNPQELVFDDFGNLFTGDNNSDGGDRARWVYVVEGGDSGWRIGYQFIQRPNARGPWNSEKLWYPKWDGQAAYIVPPIMNLGNGPSGLTYYPGVGLPERYDGHFFLCDFRGGPGSGIHSFGLEPDGASFQVVDLHPFVWQNLPTDVDFGLDGSLYWSDWVGGWNKPGKGRIYRMSHPETSESPEAVEAKALLMNGIAKLCDDDLQKLLSHASRRVRQEAQFNLADRGDSSIAVFKNTLAESDHLLARVHSIWGLGQIANDTPEALDGLVSYLDSDQPEIVVQTLRVLGDHKVQDSYSKIISLLPENFLQPRIQFAAAQALGKLGRPEAVPALADLLRSNEGMDAYLRHAAVSALEWIGSMDALKSLTTDESSHVRMGALLTMRRLGRGEVAQFLSDDDPLIVLEAARAVNDAGIYSGQGALAGLIESLTAESDPALIRRVLNANYRLGLKETALALAKYAVNGDAPEAYREESVRLLAKWPKPSGRDEITGIWRPIVAAREISHPQEALEPLVVELLHSGSGEIQLATVRAVRALELTSASPVLLATLETEDIPEAVQFEALQTLVEFASDEVDQAVQLAVQSSRGSVRGEGSKLRAQMQPNDGLAPILEALEGGEIADKQQALASLAELNSAEADAVILEWLSKWKNGVSPKAIALDISEAASARAESNPAIAEMLKSIQNTLLAPTVSRVAPYQTALWGGQAEKGRVVFYERQELACVRCHKIGDEAGGEVGPNLAGLATRRNRDYIMESIVHPNAAIAEGFETVLVETFDAALYAGVVAKETDDELVLNSPEVGELRIPKEDIISRDTGLSGMPEGLGELIPRRDLRDLMEFLSNLR